MIKFVRIASGFLFVAFNFLLMTFTFTTLFNWFLPPLGFPAITLAHAYGLILFVIYSVHRLKLAPQQKTEDKSKSYLRRLAENTYANTLLSGAALLLGWIAVSLM